MHVLDVATGEDGSVLLEVESDDVLTGCPDCGVVAIGHGRRVQLLHDAPCFGRPVRVRWRKRIWRCPEPACARRTWTEVNGSEPVVEPPQALEPARIWRIWAGQQCTPSHLGGEVTPKPESVAGGEATRKACGVLVARLQGHSRAPILPTESLVNVGTVPSSPSQPAQPGLVAGMVHRRPRAVGRGGGSVVVRGRESRPHGEGTQQGEQIWNWNVRRRR